MGKPLPETWVEQRRRAQIEGARIALEAVVKAISIAADIPRDNNVIVQHMDLVVRVLESFDPERVIQNAEAHTVDRSYLFATCSGCGMRWQSRDWHCAGHKERCFIPAKPQDPSVWSTEFEP